MKRMKPEDQDALREAANIGTGHAATALEAFVGLVTRADPPRLGKGTASLSPVEVRVAFAPPAHGELRVLLPAASARELLGILEARSELVALSELSESALRELANLLSSAYLGAIGDLVGLAIRPSVPELRLAPPLQEEAGDEVCVASRVRGPDSLSVELVLQLPPEAAEELLVHLGTLVGPSRAPRP
jgi:chemotaxis protein CheY-P-specific phosphatase CheC